METTNTSSVFHLEKWYLDCVSDTGQTAICYSAKLGWNSLAISYAGILSFDGRQEPLFRTSLLREKQPHATTDGIRWESAGLSCSGFWQPLPAKGLLPITLYHDDIGSLTWHCSQPLSKASVRTRDLEYTGLGYAEQIVMTIAPWKLPIKELLWGRFLSDNAYVVWIEWRGPHPMTAVYVNNVKVENAVVSEFALTWDGGSLELNSPACLRSGPLVKTALSSIPGVRSLFPAPVLNTHECKWRSFGKLTLHNTIQEGWAIHELVRFG
jgi:hypothetical protein